MHSFLALEDSMSDPLLPYLRLFTQTIRHLPFIYFKFFNSHLSVVYFLLCLFTASVSTKNCGGFKALTQQSDNFNLDQKYILLFSLFTQVLIFRITFHRSFIQCYFRTLTLHNYIHYSIFFFHWCSETKHFSRSVV